MSPVSGMVGQNLDTEVVHCSNCGAPPGKVVYDLADYLYGLPGCFSLRRCAACDLLYLSPRPTRDSILHYYPNTYSPYRTAIQDERFALMRRMRRAKILRRRNLVERHVRQRPGRLLDVGCSTGIFLDEMQTAGWEGTGVEINPDAASYARTRFRLPVMIGDLLELELDERMFDAITMWDVLEHTFDPHAVLQEARRLLRPGGILAFTIPNWESLDRELFGRYWIGFDAPRHLHVFPNATLIGLLQRIGFEVVANRCSFGGYFTFVSSVRTWLRATMAQPSRIAGMLERLMDLPGLRLPFEPGFSVLDWVGKGGIRVLVARRPGTQDNA